MAWFTLVSVVVVSFHVVKVCLRMEHEDVAELRNEKHFHQRRLRNASIYDFPLFFLLTYERENAFFLILNSYQNSCNLMCEYPEKNTYQSPVTIQYNL